MLGNEHGWRHERSTNTLEAAVTEQERMAVREEALTEARSAVGFCTLYNDGPEYRIAFKDAMAAISNLSLPDQQEVSKPLQSAGLSNAPVDHGPAADAKGEADDWTLDERTVREIARYVGNDWDYDICEAIKREFLPKPDPAKEMVEAWRTSEQFQEWMGMPFIGGPSAWDALARWLINNGWRKG